MQKKPKYKSLQLCVAGARPCSVEGIFVNYNVVRNNCSFCYRPAAAGRERAFVVPQCRDPSYTDRYLALDVTLQLQNDRYIAAASLPVNSKLLEVFPHHTVKAASPRKLGDFGETEQQPLGFN